MYFIASKHRSACRLGYGKPALLVLFLFLSGCATQLVRAPADAKSERSFLAQDVKFTLDSGALERSDACITVLPVKADILQGKDQVLSIRQAIKSRLVSKGYLLADSPADSGSIPTAGQVGNQAHCDLTMSIQLNTLERQFYGIYSQVRAGANLALTTRNSGKEIWTSTHEVVLRGGGVPTEPFSALLGIYSAVDNATEEQTERAVEELVRKLLGTLPDAPAMANSERFRMDGFASAFNGSIDEWLTQLPVIDREQGLVTLINSNRLSADEKESAFRRLLEIADKPRYRRDHIALSLSRRQTASAIDEATVLIRTEPVEPKNWLLLADANIQDRSWDAARTALLRAAKLRPSDARVYEKIGYVESKIGMHDRARASFLRAVKLDPRSKYANLNLALAYVNSGDIELASESLTAAGKAFLSSGDRRNAELVGDYLNELAREPGGDVVENAAREYTALLKN